MTNRTLASRSHRLSTALLGFVWTLALGPANAMSGEHPTEELVKRQPNESSIEEITSHSRMAFIENRGQWPSDILFRVGRGPLTAAVLADGFALNMFNTAARQKATRAVGLAFKFDGCRRLEGPTHLESAPRGFLTDRDTSELSVEGTEPTPGVYHFFLGADAGQWRSNVHGFGRVAYSGVWPGIDVVLRDGVGIFEYDLVLAPGADLSLAEMRVEGADTLRIDEAGRLVVETELGPLVHTAPVAWTEDAAGHKLSHPCTFRQIAPDRFGFVADAVPEGHRLIVDPGVVWSTFLGDEDEDRTRSVARAPGGDVLTTGGTYSYDFPMTLGAYDVTLNGNLDAFITRVSSDGQALVYSTFFGGSSSDHGTAIGIQQDGSVYVGGETLSTDLPTTGGAFDQNSNGLFDGFVMHLDSTGSSLLASTYFGSTGYELITDLAVDSIGRPVLVGSTSHSSFPTIPGSYDVSYGGSATDGFLTRFSADLSALEISTYLGGASNEQAECLSILTTGEFLVGGGTTSSDFPVTTGALQNMIAGSSGDQDGFLLSLDSTGQSLIWSTYLGGANDDRIFACNIDGGGGCVVAGETRSSDFPVSAGAAQSIHGGLRDAFMAFVQPTGSATQLTGATFYGGSGDESAEGLAMLSTGQIVMAGTTTTTDLPMEPWVFDSEFGAYTNNGLYDIFLARYESDQSLSYATYFGGTVDEFLVDLVDGGDGTVIFGGYTNSYNFPVSPGAFDSGYDFTGIYDGFVSRFEFLRFPFAYGNGKLHSGGSVASLSSSGFPSYANGTFDLWVDVALANSTGLFFVSSNPGAIPFAGGELLMSPPYQRTPTQTVGWLGNASLQVTIYPSMIGTTRYYQYWFADPGDAFGVGLSNAMEVFFYP